MNKNNWIPIDGKHELPTEKQQCFITVWEDWSYGKGTQISIDVDWGEFVLKDGYIPVGDNGEGFDTFNDWKEGQPVKVLAWMPFKEGVDIDEISDEELFELLNSVEPYKE